MNDKVVVFGGSGFLGSHVADSLTAEGYDVSIFDKVPSPYLQEMQTMITGDLLDRERVRDAVRGAKYVYHFAGIADIEESSEAPFDTMNVNVMGTCGILDACVKYGVERFIFASSIYVYSDLGSFYRVSKQACEKLIEEYAKGCGLKFTILRFGSLYGPRANDFNSIKNMLNQALCQGRITRRGDGEELREYIYVADAAKECVNILDSEYEDQHIIITGTQPLKIKELLLMIKEMFNHEINIEYLSGDNRHHYKITPYSFKSEVALRITPKTFHDLGEGLLESLYEIQENKEI